MSRFINSSIFSFPGLYGLHKTLMVVHTLCSFHRLDKCYHSLALSSGEHEHPLMGLVFCCLS